ncbi:hypothetical protein AAE02nite_33890 [Adhaeribacter aerolatus]|uniref:Uncharacterized protein n=1 Tax=Adhaeribacter aerolatus TaxID=670289 RepID=A0A512B189_9BACT|nr:hypothetical protein [Adhaeribacter aerolatus]GEO05725.1 hypothetical protein AAE02nite_33890 [Adhaeribacter aerolatus]
MKKLPGLMIAVSLCLLHEAASGQVLLNRVRSNIERKAEQAVDKAMGVDRSQPANSTGAAETSSGSRAGNKGGAGLVSTPPDVKANLTDAEGSFKAGKYGEARYAIQQAMLGVEMEIGQKILKSLPETISGLKKDAEQDQVTSTGWGWVGLTIQRQYKDNADKELRIAIANNAALMTGLNLYFANGGAAAQTSGGKQNWKQTKVKNNRAIIEYDEDSGYKVSVPIGQSSVVVYEGVNFKNEQDMLAAANTLDIDGIKKCSAKNKPGSKILLY